MKKKTNLNISDSSCDYIVSKIPTEVPRRQSLVVCVIISLVIFIGMMLPYKETVTVPVTINTENGITNCTVIIPSKDYRKIKIGQNTCISLDVYPKEEYGVIRGKVDCITQIYVNGGYKVNIKLLSNPSKRNSPVIFLPKMTGVAQIETCNTYLFNKLFPILKNSLLNIK